MQRILSVSRAPIGVRTTQRSASTRAVRVVSTRVASLESVSAQMDAAGIDKDEAYRRFEELLGTADVSFAQGDKVLGVSGSRWLTHWLPLYRAAFLRELFG
jgi:hypothetical protein